MNLQGILNKIWTELEVRGVRNINEWTINKAMSSLRNAQDMTDQTSVDVILSFFNDVITTLNMTDTYGILDRCIGRKQFTFSKPQCLK